MATLSVERFLERIARGKLAPAIFLLGSDVYLRELCRRKIVEAYLPEAARDWGVARYSAAEVALDRILGHARTLPMLAPRQVVFVEDVQALEGLSEEGREAARERLEKYLDDPAPFTVLVLEAEALDQRMKLYKLLSEKMQTVAVELGARPEDRGAVVVLMTRQMASEMGVEIERDAAEELADMLGGELARIRNELEKLATFVGHRGRIRRADVEALVVSAKKYSVWQLAEVLASGQRSRALEFLGSLLREGEQPAGLVGAIAWMYRKLLEAQELPPHLSGWQAAGRLGVRPATAELALKESRKISRSQLLEGLEALSEADNRLKSGSVDQGAVMEFLVARLAGSPVSAPRA